MNFIYNESNFIGDGVRRKTKIDDSYQCILVGVFLLTFLKRFFEDGISNSAKGRAYHDFSSILFPFGKRKVLLENDAMFRDLNLNQIFLAIEKGWAGYKLHEIFFAPLTTEREIKYRQEIMRDIDTDVIYALMRNFSDTMKSSRSFTSEAEKAHDINIAAVLEVQAIYVYAEAVLALMEGLSANSIKAEGYKQLTDYLKFLCTLICSQCSFCIYIW